jgi:hypothetical protein
VSRCSVNMTSFWCGDGCGGGIGFVPSRVWPSATRTAGAPGVKISLSKLASSFHFLSSPLRRTEVASVSSRPRVAISAFSSPMVRAAVALSRIFSADVIARHALPSPSTQGP